MKESRNAEMRNTLLISFFTFLGAFICAESLLAQTNDPWSINPVLSLNTSGNDVPFGVDSSYVYLKREGVHLRSPRVSNPALPGTPEKVSIVAIRDEAWDELGEIQHVSIDEQHGLAVISARPYPGAPDYDLFISSTLPTSRFKKGDTSNLWSKAYPLVSLNSSFDEVYPQFIQGGLYFASNRNETDFDIFFAPRHLQWQSASVLDFPINSDSDDLSLVVLNDDEMYVCSNRINSEGFDVYLLSRNKNESLATGFYLELTLDGNPVSGVEVKWVEPSGLHRGAVIFENTTDPQGVISLDELPSSRVLSMRIGSIESPVIEGTVVRIMNANGEVVRAYAVNTSGVLSVDFLPLDSINDLDLNDLLDLSGLPSRYPPIYTLYFDLNISTPTSQSADQLELWWQNNARDFIVKIREFGLVLEGHADVTGTTDSNESLSKKRAVWFKEWLISKGVHAEQVSTRGMGARFPVKLCPNISDPFSDCPPEVHAVNRRVELRWEVL